MDRIEIIAEAGVNHNGSLETALALVDAAAEAGVDIVKFQSFVPEALVSRAAPKAAYQQRQTGSEESQLDMLRKLALSKADHEALIHRCELRDIAFMSTPFDFASADLLIKTFGLKRLKLGSGDLTNGPLLLHIARFGVPVILSTGMATLEEIEQALGVLAFGYTSGTGCPEQDNLAVAYASPEGQAALRANVTLLQCTTEYPCPYTQVNLRALDTLARHFGLAVGLSDHTPGILIPTAAAALGVVVIEKHFTLDKKMRGPDHQASLDTDELGRMVANIRQVEQAMGSGLKAPAACEQANIPVARRSLVAARAIQAGETFNAENITIKRPGTGISPMRYWEFLGQAADRDYGEDEEIQVCNAR